ncbi:glycosyltransferase [Bacteroides fragilis]
MHKKVCCIFNYPPHYRKGIYMLMDKELSCDFYFGENVPGTLKEMECSILKGFKSRFRNIIVKGKIIWQSNTVRLLFKKEYDVYILSVDTICISEWLIIYGARLLGKKTLLWTHGWYGNESKLTQLRKKLLYLPTNGLLLYSEYAKKLLSQKGFKKEKLLVIANSLNYDNQKEIRPSLTKNNIYKNKFSNVYPTIIFIGRLEPKKQLHNILTTIYLLKKRQVNLNCVFIGNGSDKELLMKKAQELKIDKQVWFYGACYDEKQIAQLIFNADLCLSPGNVGLTSIHALSFGTPVITHNNFSHQMPEFEAIIKGVNGDFFKENDIEDMVTTTKNWFQNHPDKNAELIAHCYKIIDSKYNPYYQISIIKQALKQC